MSQTTDAYYRIDPLTAQAALVGPSGFDQHGGDLTLDASGFHLTWSNLGSQSGLYALDPATRSVSAFALQPNVTLSGLAGIRHGGTLHGADVTDDVLREYDTLYGPTGTAVPLTYLGSGFDHKRGDVDSPWCENDAACDDGDAWMVIFGGWAVRMSQVESDNVFAFVKSTILRKLFLYRSPMIM